MAGTKAERIKTKSDVTIRNTYDSRELYALNRYRIIPRVIQPPSQGQNISYSGQTAGQSGNFLSPQGDTMIGPIAFNPVDAFADSSSQSINVGEDTTEYSTYVYVSTSPAPDNFLRTIFGAGFNGQLLYIQATTDFTILDNSSTDAGDPQGIGNIFNNGVDLFVVTGQIIGLIFDPTAGSGQGLFGGWRIVSGGTGGEDAGMILGLSQDQVGGLTGTYVVVWNFNTDIPSDQTDIIDEGGGVFRLVAGSSYRLEALMSIEADPTGAGTDAVVSWQTSTDGTTGWTDIPPPFGRKGVCEVGKATLTTQPHGLGVTSILTADLFVRTLLTVTGDLTRILFETTNGFIEKLIAGTSTTGSGGGASTLDELTDVTISPDPPTVDGQVLTWDNGLQQWTNKDSVGGSQTPWISDIVGDGYKLFMEGNVTRPSPSLSGVQTIQVNAPFNVIPIPIASISGSETPRRLDIDLAGADDNFNLLVAGTLKFGYEGEAGADQMSSQVRLNMNSKDVREVNILSFASTSTQFPSQVPGILFDETAVRMKYGTKLNGGHEWDTGDPGGDPGMVLGSILEAGLGFVGGNLTDVAQFALAPQRVELTSAINGQMQVFNDNVIIISGGAARNISDINTSPTLDKIESPDQNTSVVTANGSITHTVDGVTKAVLNPTNWTIQALIDMTGKNINATGQISPILNHGNSLGDATHFWVNNYVDKLFLQNTTNTIEGVLNGIVSTVDSIRSHEWRIGTVLEFQILNNAVNIFEDTNFNGSDVTGIDDMTMLNSGSQIRMAGGDITDINNIGFINGIMQFNGLGTAITGLDSLTFTASAGANGINMAGQDIVCFGGDINQGGGSLITEDAEINGTINHDGSLIGFFNNPPITQPSITTLGGTPTNAQLQAKLNEVILALGDINGLGLFAN